jgi:hypothetical protein
LTGARRISYNAAVFNKLSLNRKDILIYLLLTLAAVSAIVAINQLRKPTLTIQWTTESEIDVLGFNLLRSARSDGEYGQINESLIPPAQDPFIGGEYSYQDEAVRRGQTYYYRLETIYRDGHTTLSEPIEIRAGG